MNKEKWRCFFCGKEYDVYPVILDGNPLSLASYITFRERYYDEEKGVGICKECFEEKVIEELRK